MLDFLKEKLLPAAVVTLASTYLFTIGVLDALGIDATPSIQTSAIFVFRTTFETFAKSVFEQPKFAATIPITIALASYIIANSVQIIRNFKVKKERKDTIVILVGFLVSAGGLYFTARSQLEYREILIFATVFVAVLPFVGATYIQFVKDTKAIWKATVLVAIAGLVLSSYFVGGQALRFNMKFPMIQIARDDSARRLKVWETDQDVYVIKCGTTDSIQIWRWEDGGNKLRQTMVSNGHNSLADICNRSTR